VLISSLNKKIGKQPVRLNAVVPLADKSVFGFEIKAGPLIGGIWDDRT
jgi:hypothetical protein